MITIDEAIEAGELIVKYPKTPIGSYTLRAIQLGIEGLKREKFNRENPDFVIVGQLPGETKD